MTAEPRLIRFGDFALDLQKCALLQFDKEIKLRPKAFDVLHYLVQNYGRVVPKEELIESVWVDVHVTDDALVQCVREVRHALSDNARIIVKTVPRRGYLFSLEPVKGTPATRDPVYGDDAIEFCQTRDGVKIAMSATGQGLPLIRPPTWFNHIAYDWNVEFRSALYQFVARQCQLIRYDGRGSGLSDRYVQDISFESFGFDLEAVAEARGLEKYALLGISQGGAVAIAHAARYPERVAKLVINGSFAQGIKKRGSTKDAETGDAYLTLMRHGWGDEHSAFLRSYGMLYFPGASAAELRASADVQRMAMTGDVAVRTRIATEDIDVTTLLPKIVAPTLILHSRHDNAVPFEEGLRLAAGIPNARFVALESENHCPMPNEPAWDHFIEEIGAFLLE
ncbi:MAG TPA: alpha/beta fold hydrolase [Hyphomicrobiaceae bacterium]|nr:alpha/beta fold hydrolase [Hyphomicrobiaceae bacterium]